MKGIHVTSEIKPLKKVLLHRPGRELLNLTPNTLEELLFDDIPYLKVAEEEHDAFSQVLRDNGVEVVYLEDLVAQVLDISPEIREEFLRAASRAPRPVFRQAYRLVSRPHPREDSQA